MVMFLAINTSSVTLVSSNILAMRVAAGSVNPTEMIGITMMSTTVSTIVAIVATRLLQNLPMFRLPEQLTESDLIAEVDDTPSAS